MNIIDNNNYYWLMLYNIIDLYDIIQYYRINIIDNEECY